MKRHARRHLFENTVRTALRREISRPDFNYNNRTGPFLLHLNFRSLIATWLLPREVSRLNSREEKQEIATRCRIKKRGCHVEEGVSSSFKGSIDNLEERTRSSRSLRLFLWETDDNGGRGRG